MCCGSKRVDRRDRRICDPRMVRDRFEEPVARGAGNRSPCRGAAGRGCAACALRFGALAATFDWATARPGSKREPVSSPVRMFAITAAMVVLPDALTRFTRSPGDTPVPYGAPPLFSFLPENRHDPLRRWLLSCAMGWVINPHWLTELQLLDVIAVGHHAGSAVYGRYVYRLSGGGRGRGFHRDGGDFPPLFHTRRVE